MEIDAMAGGHFIFEHLDISGTLILEGVNASKMDEQVYNTDPDDPNSPADWAVLANFGPNMCFVDKPAIVEFTTSNGTTVILDGSANTSDKYGFWTLDRWDLLYNEVLYLID